MCILTMAKSSIEHGYNYIPKYSYFDWNTNMLAEKVDIDMIWYLKWIEVMIGTCIIRGKKKCFITKERNKKVLGLYFHVTLVFFSTNNY